MGPKMPCKNGVGKNLANDLLTTYLLLITIYLVLLTIYLLLLTATYYLLTTPYYYTTCLLLTTYYLCASDSHPDSHSILDSLALGVISDFCQVVGGVGDSLHQIL